MRQWMGFSAFYNHFEGNAERERLMAVKTHSMSDEQAKRVLDDCRSAIEYLAAFPPGDMRRDSSHPAFYRRAKEDMRAVLDDRLSTRKQLAHLVAVVYQVRCNLFHGEKDPRNERDSKLIGASDTIMESVMDRLLLNARAA
jgi:hypothetical protein